LTQTHWKQRPESLVSAAFLLFIWPYTALLCPVPEWLCFSGRKSNSPAAEDPVQLHMALITGLQLQALQPTGYLLCSWWVLVSPPDSPPPSLDILCRTHEFTCLNTDHDSVLRQKPVFQKRHNWQGSDKLISPRTSRLARDVTMG